MISIDFFSPEIYDIILFYLGIVIIVATLFPRFLSNYMITAPIAYLLIAVFVFSLYPESPSPHIGEEPYLGERLTELGVIISLTAAGLKIKNPFSWQTWRYAARLLIITMPLTIALIAFLGWKYLGFAPATAILLGAAIAPTDPVLASDIQTSSPREEDVSSTRLALTSEAGLNDGLAFPFTNMAIAMALIGVSPSLWFTDWLVTDFFYKIIVGTLAGLITGWLLAKIIYCAPQSKCNYSAQSIGLLAISLTLFPYGFAQILHSYGFIAVFIAACMFKKLETTHEYLDILHNSSEEMERTMVVVLFTLAGIYISNDYLADFQWYMIPASIIIVMIIRPLTGLIGLIGSGLPGPKKYIMSFYGIRGIGSIYYLLYAFHYAEFEQSNEALALVTTVIVLSVFVHGLSARPVLKRWLPG